jgi:transcriptional regulator with XRE-family HTH domain
MQENQDLQSILDKMFASEKNFTFEVVRDWQNRYPQFSHEIAEAIADWREFEFLVLDDAETIEAAKLSETAKNAMEKALANGRPQSAVTITDLRETLEKKGIVRESLLKILGVSETLMRKIERRNLKGIPNFIEEKLGEILEVSAENLRAFFDLPSVLPKAARFKSKNTPQTLPKQSFAEAVRNDPELSDEEKQKLLNLK